MSNLEPLYKTLRQKHITLDCNVFLLFVVGKLGKKHIGEFKRTNCFTDKHFDSLMKLIQNSQGIVMSQSVFVEASNLLESYNFKKEKIGLFALKQQIQVLPEVQIPSKNLTDLSSFPKFGLSDSSMEYLCQKGVIPITVDFGIWSYLASNYQVLNLNNLYPI